MEELFEKARAKLEAEETEHGTPQDMAKKLICAWLHHDPQDAAPRILEEGRSVTECYKHIKAEASKLRQSSVNANPETEVVWMLGYFGIKKEAAKSAVEGGLLYAIFQSLAEEWKPYGTGGAASSVAPAPLSSVPPVKNPAPAFMGRLEDFL